MLSLASYFASSIIVLIMLYVSFLATSFLIGHLSYWFAAGFGG
jgi:hypothetical protein